MRLTRNNDKERGFVNGALAEVCVGCTRSRLVVSSAGNVQIGTLDLQVWDLDIQVPCVELPIHGLEVQISDLDFQIIIDFGGVEGSAPGDKSGEKVLIGELGALMASQGVQYAYNDVTNAHLDAKLVREARDWR